MPWIAGALLVLASHAAAARAWTIVDLGTLGGDNSFAAAVSGNGTVAGCADLATDAAHAFTYRDGAMLDLGTGGPEPGSSCATAVNSAGVAAGRSSTGELVIWQAGAVTPLGIQGDVAGINGAGVVAGTIRDGPREEAFIYRDGMITRLGVLGDAAAPGAYSIAHAINARGEVVGASNGRAFLYADGLMQDIGAFAEGAFAWARGINDRGDVVGMSTGLPGGPRPFLWDGRQMHVLPGTQAEAIAVNNRRQVVGWEEGFQGVLIENGVSTRLQSLLPAGSGWSRFEPKDINERGWITGYATNGDGHLRAFLMIPGG